MKFKNLSLKTIDKKIKCQFKSVHIFSVRYSKKIKNNEFHSPLAARVIVETKDIILHWLFSQLFVISDYDGNIFILTNATYKQIIQKKPYFDKKNLKKAIYLKSIYENKEEFGMLPNEIIEKYWAQNIFNLNSVLKIKIPYQIGGGF